MKVCGRYRVSGRSSYRGHDPGTEFVATLNANAERRALVRGSIVVLERIVPAVQPGSYRLPRGWLE